ncbi:ferredoxin [Rhodococcus sp. BE178]|uniref:ferredoxin n=1 Tax=Rhodococcus sp. BE178 TaxID=2817737 RepID=UPI003D1D49A2
MRVNVDMSSCQHYGQCVFAAPEVFDLDGDGKLQYRGDAAEDQRAAVEAAADACPMQAITIVD